MMFILKDRNNRVGGMITQPYLSKPPNINIILLYPFAANNLIRLNFNAELFELLVDCFRFLII